MAELEEATVARNDFPARAFVAALVPVVMFGTGCSQPAEGSGSPDVPATSDVEPSTSDVADLGLSLTGLPAAFESEPSWAVPVLADAEIKPSDAGILVQLPSAADDAYRVAVLDEATGDTKWSSRPLSSVEPPTVDWVTQGGIPWVVVTVTKENGTVAVYSYNGLLSGDKPRPSDNAAAFAPGRGEDAAIARITDRGVLIRNSAVADSVQWRPSTGENTVLNTGAVREGVEALPTWVYDDGVLLTYQSDKGFAYASGVGGWESSDVAPEGAAALTGTMKKANGGYVVAEWRTEDPDTDDVIWAVHRISNGQVIAQYQTEADDADFAVALERSRGLVVSTDKRWISFGSVIFPTVDDAEPFKARLNGGIPTVIHDDILYAMDAQAPLAVPGLEEGVLVLSSTVPEPPSGEDAAVTSATGDDASSTTAPPEESADATTATADAEGADADSSTATGDVDSVTSTEQPAPEPSPLVLNVLPEDEFTGFIQYDLNPKTGVLDFATTVPIAFTTGGLGLFVPEGKDMLVAVPVRESDDR